MYSLIFFLSAIFECLNYIIWTGYLMSIYLCIPYYICLCDFFLLFSTGCTVICSECNSDHVVQLAVQSAPSTSTPLEQNDARYFTFDDRDNPVLPLCNKVWVCMVFWLDLFMTVLHYYSLFTYLTCFIPLGIGPRTVFAILWQPPPFDSAFRGLHRGSHSLLSYSP